VGVSQGIMEKNFTQGFLNTKDTKVAKVLKTKGFSFECLVSPAPLFYGVRGKKGFMTRPSLGFVLLFLLFSGLFLSNSYKLWFKTDTYYQDLYNSLTDERTPYPFKSFFLKRLENKQNWLLWQKIFSLLGIAAVLTADVLVLIAYLQR